MLNSSERSNSVSWLLCSAFRVRAENPNSLMTMTFSSLELGVVSAAMALETVFAEYSCLSGDAAPSDAHAEITKSGFAA
jgi:hypothetical protein